MNQVAKLVSGRLKTQAAGPHPDPDLLAALAENALPDTDRARLLQHLGTCPDCREILYLTMPDSLSSSSEAEKSLVFTHRRRAGFALRWVAVAASVVIVGGLFLTRFQAHKRGVTPAAPAFEKFADKKIPVDLDELRDAGTRDALRGKADAAISTNENKRRPAAKHMTARPQSNFEFDKAEQVRLQPPSSVPQRQQTAQVQIRGRDSSQLTKSTDSAVSGQAGSAAANQVAKDVPHSASEMVEVTAGAPAVETGNAAATDKKQTTAEFDREGGKPAQIAAGAAGKVAYRAGAAAATLSVVLSKWTLSPKGAVQRSFDAGKTWQTISVNPGMAFRALSAEGTQVWAGGNGGVLYHSADSGQTWVRVEPVASGQKLTGNITRIDFSDGQNGTVNTANGEAWSTSDGGQSWRRR
jgi:Photosynthesis system II assembly factor YCF48/Putative zinc-finger